MIIFDTFLYPRFNLDLDYFAWIKNGRREFFAKDIAQQMPFHIAFNATEQEIIGYFLLLACCSSQEGIVDVVAAILSDKRIDPLISDLHNNKALHFAAYTGRDDVISLLLKTPRILENINCVNEFGMTALHVLALSSKRQIMRLASVSLLVKNGIDLFAVDNEGRTAYDIAVAVGNQVVAHALLLAMYDCLNTDSRIGGGGPSEGLAPKHLIMLEKNILTDKSFQNFTGPCIEQNHFYKYPNSTIEPRTCTHLKLNNL